MSAAPKNGSARSRTKADASGGKSKRDKMAVSAASAKPRCPACDVQVGARAKYCRACGKPVDPSVGPNPHLPPPPKSWRPSRIPKHHPKPTTVAGSPAWPAVDVPEPNTDKGGDQTIPESLSVLSTVVEPAAVEVWKPVPEIEARMQQVRARNDALRPALVPAGFMGRRRRLG